MAARHTATVRSICGLYDFQSEDRLTGGLLALFH
jgi:hypothetical protein